MRRAAGIWWQSALLALVQVVACPAAFFMGVEMKSFEYGTGILGATAPNQKVTSENAHELPPGSVVRIGDGSRLIHLHDTLWLWCCDHAWCYDLLENLLMRLDDQSVACHIAPE